MLNTFSKRCKLCGLPSNYTGLTQSSARGKLMSLGAYYKNQRELKREIVFAIYYFFWKKKSKDGVKEFIKKSGFLAKSLAIVNY